MMIRIMVEGKTENAFMPVLRDFLKTRLEGPMPALKPVVYNGGVPTGNDLNRDVANLLSGKKPADHVIWLTDVYVDKQNPGKGLWQTAQQAKDHAAKSVDPKYHAQFHPHVALHDFEAWHYSSELRRQN